MNSKSRTSRENPTINNCNPKASFNPAALKISTIVMSRSMSLNRVSWTVLTMSKDSYMNKFPIDFSTLSVIWIIAM